MYRIRRRGYDPRTGTITLSVERAQAIRSVSSHYESLFGNDPATTTLRENYAMKNDTIPDAAPPRDVGLLPVDGVGRDDPTAGQSNHIHQQLAQRTCSGQSSACLNLPLVGVERLILLAGIALLGWHHAVTHARKAEKHDLPATDPLRGITVTPSMQATAKYFWVVLALFLVQILFGAMTAHYQIEGQLVYGYEAAEILPYAITRTWHTQLAVLWIATA